MRLKALLPLALRYSGTDERIETLEKELESCRKQALFDKDTAQSALSTLRQSQYGALTQLQVGDQELQSAYLCFLSNRQISPSCSRHRNSCIEYSSLSVCSATFFRLTVLPSSLFGAATGGAPF